MDTLDQVLALTLICLCLLAALEWMTAMWWTAYTLTRRRRA